MQKNSITNKITPCCGLPFSVVYWWVSNLTLNSEADREFIISKISQGGIISIDAWKILINSGTLEADASLTKAEFLAWFDCGNQPTCEQLKIIIESYQLGVLLPSELPDNIATIDGFFAGVEKEGTTFTKAQILALVTTDFGGEIKVDSNPEPVGNMWFIASESGVYANAGGLSVDIEEGFTILNFDDGVWSKIVFPISVKSNEIEIYQQKEYASGKQFLKNNIFYRVNSDKVLLSNESPEDFVGDKVTLLKDLYNDILINGDIEVKEIDLNVNIKVLNDSLIYDALGGYRILKAQNYSFPNNVNNVIYLSASDSEFIDPKWQKRGNGENVYLISESFDTKHYVLRSNPISVASTSSSNGYVAKIDFFKMTPDKIDRYILFEQNGTLPPRNFVESQYIEQLKPFIDKYRERKSDVTLVQTGDSISTNLGWTTPRADAMYRPPMMTEHNLNSYLEEKLRWREQKYRRFDAPNVFTEILGGGTSTQMWDDGGVGGAWGITGNAYSLPLTKVIDGGTNSGVTYKFPAKMRRCNFILHTDYKWANTTKITVSQGNGLVQVKNDSDVWVEANNYVFSAQESPTLINGAFRKSQEQKRVHMRSLTNLTEKTITIQNVGAGRFGYWGVEYSPNEFMFTYVCASIGSQALYGMSFYESWRVDAFKPDLLLQQCCIINEGAISGETASPVITPEGFVQHFAEDYDRQIGKGYLVMPYIVWGGAVMGMVNPVTGEWGFSTYNGKNLTIDDYIGQLMNMYTEKEAPAVNFFYRFTELAERKAKLEGTNNIYTSAINGSGGDGNTFTIDTVHLNDYGEEILKRLLLPYFNL